MNVKLENLKYRSILLSHSNQASQQQKEQTQESNLTTDKFWVLLVDSLWSAIKTKAIEEWWSKLPVPFIESNCEHGHRGRIGSWRVGGGFSHRCAAIWLWAVVFPRALLVVQDWCRQPGLLLITGASAVLPFTSPRPSGAWNSSKDGGKT